MSGLMNVYFLGLSAGGFDSLWGSLMRSGAAQALGVIKATGLLPSGDRLITTYTGLPWIDKLVLSPVIFYDSLMYTRDPVHRAILVSVFSSMQATSFAMLLNDTEEGSIKWQSLLEHAAWGVFNQSYGAAFAYPLYCLSRTSHHLTARQSLLGLARDPIQAEALVYSSILFAVTPIWLLYPAFVNCTSEARQLLIASYRASPLLLAFCQPVMTWVLRQLQLRTGRTLLSKRPEFLTRLSLYIAAGSSTLGHIYAILTALSSPGASIARVFSPWADIAQGASVLQRGSHLFLQNDLIVIAAALAPFVTMIFGPKKRPITKNGQDGRVTGWVEKLSALKGARRLVAWSCLTVLASPGAVFPLAMASVA